MLLCRVHLVEGAAQVVVYLQHRSIVVEFIAVVRGTKYCHKLLVGEELVPILHHLVATHYQIEAVLLEEFIHHQVTKYVGDTALTFTPALCHQVEDEGRQTGRRIRPEKVA